MCLFNWWFSEKLFWQTSQLNGFSPVWIFKCFVLVCFSLKALSQKSHLNAFSPVWIFKWFVLCCFSLKAFPQKSQLYGLSSVCTLKCISKWVFVAKLFPHNSQACGFTPLCNFICVDKDVLHENCFVHRSQIWAVSPECFDLICKLKEPFCLNEIPHGSHLKAFSSVWVFKCFWSETLYLNCRKQTLQRKSSCGLKCTFFKCEFKPLSDVKPFSQNSHTKGLSPVWMFSWAFSSLTFGKLLLQN